MKTPSTIALHSQRAFSLIELIVVISIIVLIAGFAVPAASTIIRGSALSQASNAIIGQISLARQQALTKNRAVEVRFYRFADPETPGEDVANPSTGKFRAVQLFEVLENGVAVPLDKAQMLPNTVIFAYTEDKSVGLSSIIDQAKAGTPKKPGTNDRAAQRLPRGIDYNYEFVSFRFLQDGSTDLSPTDSWYVTLIGLNDRLKTPSEPPPNFFTVQVDPVSGSTRSFRPTSG
jgi:uncharacterized protein (TIGR02596 family)